MALRIHIRDFVPGDAAGVAALFVDYMREIYRMPSAMSAEVLCHAGCGRHFRLVVAVDGEGSPVGFAAWRPAYDLHHAVAGGEIPDLFVARDHRGRGLSIRLVAAVARAVQSHGGGYLRGEVLLDDRRRLRLLHRIRGRLCGRERVRIGAGVPADGEPRHR